MMRVMICYLCLSICYLYLACVICTVGYGYEFLIESSFD